MHMNIDVYFTTVLSS